MEITNEQIYQELTELKLLLGQILNPQPDKSSGQVIPLARQMEIRKQAEMDMRSKGGRR